MAKKKSTNTPTPAKTLRQRAEEMLRMTRTEIASMAADDVQALVHELQVHQIELQIQNEELRHAQVELSESRDGYADLYDFAPVGYVTLGHDGRVLEANLAVATMLGVDRKELLKSHLTNFVRRESQDLFYLHRQEVFSSDHKQIAELEMNRADGALLIVRLESIAFGVEGQRRCRTALIDITEQKKAELVLRELNVSLDQSLTDRTTELHKSLEQITLLSKAIANLGEGVMITNDKPDWPECHILFVNEAICRITGYTKDELIGKPRRILHGKATERDTLERVKAELAAGQSVLAELTNYRKDGTSYDAEIFVTPMFESRRTRQRSADSSSIDQSLATSATERTTGRRTNFVSIHRDVTERKRAERALRDSESRLATEATALSRLNDATTRL